MRQSERHEVGKDERRADPLAHPVRVERHDDERADENREQADARHEERRVHLDVELLPAVRRVEEDHVRAREADAEEDVEHRPAEAGGDSHRRVAHALRARKSVSVSGEAP